jgi:hypothetical protein
MTAQVNLLDEVPGQARCWCCGAIDDQAKLVHLGDHPEVTICIRCAHSASKWASEIQDQSRTGFAASARNTFRRARKTVVRRSWHHNKLIGRPLRWLGKHTP